MSNFLFTSSDVREMYQKMVPNLVLLYLVYYNLLLSCEYQCILLTSGDVRRKLNTNSDFGVSFHYEKMLSIEKASACCVYDYPLKRFTKHPYRADCKVRCNQTKTVRKWYNTLSFWNTYQKIRLTCFIKNRRPMTFKRNCAYSAIKLEIWKKMNCWKQFPATLKHFSKRSKTEIPNRVSLSFSL